MADNLDLNGILKMFQMGPTPQERSEAGASALARMGLGILAANRSGPTLQVGRPTLFNMAGQGGLSGMDAYQASLNQQMADRKQGGVLALQAMQIKKAMDQQAALAGLVNQAKPQPLPQVALAQGASQGDIGPTVTNGMRLGALEQNPVASQYTPIPLDKLAVAKAAGVDIGDFLKLNEAALPKLEKFDAGGQLIVKDLRSGQERIIPKTAAPASIPFEASDFAQQGPAGAASYRDFLLSKGKAGAANLINNVNAFEPFNNKLQQQQADALVKQFEGLQNLPDQIASLDAAKQAALKAAPFVGSGAEGKLEVIKFLNNNLGTNIAPEGVKNAELFRSAGFRMVLDNLKKMDSQPSERQQEALQKAMGKLDTDPSALPDVLDVTKDILMSRGREHNRRVAEAKANGAKFIYDISVPLDRGPSTISPDLQRLLDKYAPR